MGPGPIGCEHPRSGIPPQGGICASVRRRKARPAIPATIRVSVDDPVCIEGPVTDYETVVRAAQGLKDILHNNGIEADLAWSDPSNSSIGNSPCVCREVGPELAPEVPRATGRSWAEWLFPTDYSGVASDIVNFVANGDGEGDPGMNPTRYFAPLLKRIKETCLGNHGRRHRVCLRAARHLGNLRPLLDELRTRASADMLRDTSTAGKGAVEVCVRRVLKDWLEEGRIERRSVAFYQRVLVALAPVVTDDDRLAAAISRVVGEGGSC